MAYSPPGLAAPILSYTFAFFMWLLSMKGFAQLLGGWRNYSLMCALLMVVAFVTLRHVKYWWRKPFEGITIKVREPIKKFSGMEYKYDPSDLGPGPLIFIQMQFLNFSALLVSFELFIHGMMGHDKDRAHDDGDNVAPEGMMQQEMNHGKLQLFYSKAAERDLKYPAGYRRLWKIIFFDIWPLHLRQAFVLWVECDFIASLEDITSMPQTFDKLPNAWALKYHLMEEAEHCWDSVPHLVANCPLGWRIFCWLLMWPFAATTKFALPIIEAFIYGYKAIFKKPMQFLLSLLLYVPLSALQIFQTQANTLMAMVLGMRPADEVYHGARQAWEEKIYSSVADQFIVTHIQEPHQHVHENKPKGKAKFRAAVDAVIAAEKIAFAFHAPGPEQKKPPLTKQKSITALGEYRRSLYDKTVQELIDYGMTLEEIAETPFGELQTILDQYPNKYEPPKWLENPTKYEQPAV